jgi:ATP-binding cassette subfamily B protein
MRYIKFYRYLRPFWKKEVVILLLSGIGTGLSLVNPYLAKLIIDRGYGEKNLKLFIALIALGGLIFVLTGALTAFGNYLNRYITLRVNFDLKRKLFRKMVNLPYGFFQNTSTGENLYKLDYDADRAGTFITETPPKAISLVPRLFFIFVIILYLDRKMALFIFALTPFLYLVPFYFTKRLKATFAAWIENSERVFEKLGETLLHMQLIKAFGKEKREERNFVKKIKENTRITLKNTGLKISGSFVNSLANRIILGLIILYGGYQVIKGNMTLGSLSAISIYLAQLSNLQHSLAQLFQEMSLGGLSCRRLERLLDASAESAENKKAKEVIFSEGKIQLKDITFGYEKKKKVLQGLNLSVPGRTHASLVGPSGCGKTTLINLILRLYKFEKGKIFIDNSDIRDIKSKSLYGQIGLVLQEPYLWNDTIENNIRYGKNNADFAEVAEAAKFACIDNFIAGLPERYNTIIGENACKVSEGEKQRIAIARAIIKKPKILILDEAFSSIDAKIEDRVIDNIKDALSDSTIIIVSHRLSTITKMDLVYFLNRPDKIEIGIHKELLEKNVNYQNYLAHQLEESYSAR